MVDDYKNRSSEILGDENREIFRKKVKFRKFSAESENFSKIGGKSETGGNASWPQGEWTPLSSCRPKAIIYSQIRGNIFIVGPIRLQCNIFKYGQWNLLTNITSFWFQTSC